MSQEKAQETSWNNPAFSMLNLVFLILSVPVLLIVDVMMLLVKVKNKTVQILYR